MPPVGDAVADHDRAVGHPESDAGHAQRVAHQVHGRDIPLRDRVGPGRPRRVVAHAGVVDGLEELEHELVELPCHLGVDAGRLAERDRPELVAAISPLQVRLGVLAEVAGVVGVTVDEDDRVLASTDTGVGDVVLVATPAAEPAAAVARRNSRRFTPSGTGSRSVRSSGWSIPPDEQAGRSGF